MKKEKTIKLKSLYANPDNPQKYTPDDIAAQSCESCKSCLKRK